MMRASRSFLLLLILVGVLVGCEQAPVTPVAKPTPQLSPAASAYLNAALDFMQKYSVHRKQIDWPHLRQQAFDNATGASTPAETYYAIRLAVLSLGDRHSLFVEPELAKEVAETPLTPPKGQRLSQGVGYLELPGLSGTKESWQQYALLAQQSIRNIDHVATCGWIIDLRTNKGGNMWPMLVGVGPILGEGIVGAFVNADNVSHFWSYIQGQAKVDGSTVQTVTSPYQLKHPAPPVAVLTGPLTASAGEAIVVSFRGRAHTRSFGAPTSGVPTANTSFTLSDGALLVITASFDADRTGKVYTSSIAPDQPVQSHQSPASLNNDPVVQAATTWLHQQQKCQKPR